MNTKDCQWDYAIALTSFKKKTSELFHDFENVHAHIDDLMCVMQGTWLDHLSQVDKVLQRLKTAGLKVNAKKSKFGSTNVEHLGFIITRKGLKPQAKKVSVTMKIKPPQTRKQLRRFLGMLNECRDFII